MTYAPAKFEVTMSNFLGGDAFSRKKYITIGLDLNSRLGSRSNKTYPLHHMTSAPAKFEAATSNGSDGSRNVTDGQTYTRIDKQSDGGADDRPNKAQNYMTFLYNKKAGIQCVIMCPISIVHCFYMKQPGRVLVVMSNVL